MIKTLQEKGKNTMKEFYQLKGKIYHNGIYLYTANLGSYFAAEQEPDETIELTWDNLKEYYSKYFGLCFSIFNAKRGRIVSFHKCSLIDYIKHKEWRDIHERKSPLNITIKCYSVKLTKSVDEVIKWHNAEEAIQYLTEHGLSIK